MKVDFVKNKYRFFFDYDQSIISFMRVHSKRRFCTKTSAWLLTADSIEQKRSLIKILEKFNWELDPIISIHNLRKEVGIRDNIVSKNIDLSRSYNSDLEIRELNFKLYPYQVPAVKYVIDNKRVIIADDMGLGKTIEALAAIYHLDQFPLLITCPNSLSLMWEREWNKWTNNLKVKSFDSSFNINKIKGFDVFICNYEAAIKFKKEFKKIGFKSLIIDESHKLSNKKTLRRKAIKEISKSIEYIIELTGTAISSKPLQLIPQLDMIRVLDDFKGEESFKMRYCDGKKNITGWDFSGASNTKELHEKLRKFCYIRRESKEVQKELPELTEVIIPLEINNRSEHKSVNDDLLEYVKNKNYNEEELRIYLEESTNLKWENLTPIEKERESLQYALNKVESTKSTKGLVKTNLLRQLTIKGKLDSAIGWIEDFLENDKKLVLVVKHIEIGLQLSKKFNCEFMYSKTKKEKRQNQVDDFQQKEEVKMIILNDEIGGVGWTLTSAQHLAILELPWSSTEVDQIKKRIHRNGQLYPSFLYFLIGLDTFDDDMLEMIGRKRFIAESVNNGK